MSAPYSFFSVSISLRAASDTLTRSAAKAITSAIGRLRSLLLVNSMSCPENIKRLSCWRHAEFALGLFGRLLRRFEMSDHFSFFGKERDDRALGRVDNVVSVLHRKPAVDLQTEFDEGAVARVPRTKIENSPRARTGDCRCFNALALLVRQLVIQELARRSNCYVPSTLDHKAGDQE